MKYPIGIQNFEELIQTGCVYIDKTSLIYKMIDEGKYYFLSRPRRFGKSLLISTLEAFFSGKKELFEGLAISKLENDWRSYPILHLDLNSREYKDESSLEAELNRHLEQWEKLYGDEFRTRATEERFLQIIDKAYEKTGKQVVILVDEYDKPMLQAIDNKELQDAYRSKLKAFYSVLKTQDAKIRFAFLTGVTKFGKVSVFSDLNHLADISLDCRYADICGISETDFANGDYALMGDKELYFHNAVYVFFMLLGFYVDVERHTTDGRMDILMQTSDYIYILELKIDQSADVALRQIEEKEYDKPFASDPRGLFKIGINFSTEKRCIDDWRIAE